MTPSHQNPVSAVRAFSRFYTRQLGLLEKGLYHSDFSLSEVRALYELAHNDGLTATDLAHELRVDAGYLSRMLSTLQRRGLIERTSSREDRRRKTLALTDAGRAAFTPIERASQAQIAAMLEQLMPDERQKLVAAMGTIQRLLDADTAPEVPYILRPHQPGDMGWVIHRQAVLYNHEYGWDGSFEVLLAEIAGAFIESFDPKTEFCRIAEREGEIVGSVFLARDSDDTAKLRMLYVEPSARGLGLGRHLVSECIRFAKSHGYEKITLWTNDILAAARHIYEMEGFELVASTPHHSFGKDLVGEIWELSL